MSFKYIAVAIFVGVFSSLIGILSANDLSSNQDSHDLSLHCRHVPNDCKNGVSEGRNTVTSNTTTSNTTHTDLADLADEEKVQKLPTESGQGMFGALSEINKIIEQSRADWSRVDMDRLWEHLRDMDALMTGSRVSKTIIPDGLKMRISGEGASKRAMDNMLPAHSNFLQSVRPDWNIKINALSKVSEPDYEITVTSTIPHEVIRIQALGFSGFMVQDDHHTSHHLGLALGDQVH